MSGERGKRTEAQLHIAKDLDVPLDAVTRVFGVVAQRGAGKSYTASVLTEEMVSNGLHVGCIDPLGIMWGIRSSIDGTQPGFPVLILGGRHADLPLDYTAGKIVAQFVAEVKQPFILDLSLFEEQDQQCQFVADFLDAFRTYEEVILHLIIDEADLFAPQVPETAQERRSLKAMNALTRRYRVKGFGATLISQRPAVINKNVLSMIDVLFALRIVSPQDIKALDEWIKRNASEAERAEFLATISSLPTGTAWVWSPQWLHLFQKKEIRQRTTFDSSATPKIGITSRVPRQLAEVDISQIRTQLAEQLQRVQETDPALLHVRIRDLQEQLQTAREHTPGERRKKKEDEASTMHLRAQIQHLELQLIDEQKEKHSLQQRLAEKEQAHLPAAPSTVHMERLHARSVMIERAEIQHYIEERKENGETPVIVPARKQQQREQKILASQKDTLETMKRRIQRLSPFEQRVMRFLLDHDGSEYTWKELAAEMGLLYTTFKTSARRANSLKGLINLPFIAATMQGQRHIYKSTFSQFFQHYDLSLVREELSFL